MVALRKKTVEGISKMTVPAAAASRMDAIANWVLVMGASEIRLESGESTPIRDVVKAFQRVIPVPRLTAPDISPLMNSF